MTKAIKKPVNPRTFSLFAVGIALLTELLVVVDFVIFNPPSPQWVAAGALFFFYGLSFLLILFFDEKVVVVNLLFAFALIQVIILLMLFSPNETNMLVLIYPIAAFSTIYLPLQNGLIWIGGLFLGLITFIGFAAGFNEFISSLAILGAFASYGFIGALIRRSNQAFYGMEALYDDLQEAHTQLQEYSQSVRELAVSEERNRLAREMHDSLGHSLTVAVVQLEGAERLIPTDPQRAGRIINAMRQQLKDSLGELRQTLSRLREQAESPDAPIGNLALALAELETTFADATGLPVHLKLPANLPALTADQRLAFFRTAQEGLTNIQRHARAAQAWVSVDVSDQIVTLTVADDGVGLPDEPPDGRFGLQGLAERARVLGGAFDVGPRKNGSGTTLMFALPRVNRQEQGDE